MTLGTGIFASIVLLLLAAAVWQITARKKCWRIVPIALSGIIFLNGCEKSEPLKRVVIDDWWNVDYAKNACATSGFASELPACSYRDPTAEVRNFEDQLVTYFASVTKCHGVSVSSYKGPSQTKPPVLDTNRDWSLMLDFLPGQSTQAWTLVGHNPSYLTGKGSEKEIVSQICTALNRNGANVEN